MHVCVKFEWTPYSSSEVKALKDKRDRSDSFKQVKTHTGPPFHVKLNKYFRGTCSSHVTCTFNDMYNFDYTYMPTC